MSNRIPAAVLASILALTSTIPGASNNGIRFNHKEKTKHAMPEKVAKMRRNRPAKGYDSVNHKWVNP